MNHASKAQIAEGYLRTSIIGRTALLKDGRRGRVFGYGASATGDYVTVRVDGGVPVTQMRSAVTILEEQVTKEEGA